MMSESYSSRQMPNGLRERRENNLSVMSGKSPQLTFNSDNHQATSSSSASEIPIISTPPKSPTAILSGQKKLKTKQLSLESSTTQSSLSVSKRLTTTLAFLQAGRESERGVLAREVTKCLQERHRLARLHKKAEKSVQKLLDRRREQENGSSSISDEEIDDLEEAKQTATADSSEKQETSDSIQYASRLDSYLGSHVSRKNSIFFGSQDGKDDVSREKDSRRSSQFTDHTSQHLEKDSSDLDLEQKATLTRQALKAADEEAAAKQLTYRLKLQEEKDRSNEAQKTCKEAEKILLEDEESLARKTFYLLPKDHPCKEEIKELIDKHRTVEHLLIVGRKKLISRKLVQESLQEEIKNRAQNWVKRIDLTQAAIELEALQEENILCRKQQAKMRSALKAESSRLRTFEVSVESEALQHQKLEQSKSELEDKVDRLRMDLKSVQKRGKVRPKSWHQDTFSGRTPLTASLRKDCKKSLEYKESYEYAFNLLNSMNRS